MKKKNLIFCTFFLCFAFTAFAQPNFGGFQRRTVEERVKIIHDKLDSTFNKELGEKKFALVDSAFADYYRAQDKMREELMAGGPPDDATRDALRTKMQEIAADRDAKLQKILSEAQYKKWKDELEPALRPQRRMPQ